MGKARSRGVVRTYRFQRSIRAPLPFVFRWWTDYREDDDRLTRSLYQYRARIVLREPRRVVRIITLPGRTRNALTDVEVISLRPPDRWHLEKMSATDDETGEYALTRVGPHLTRLDMRFRQRWKLGRPSDRAKYLALCDRVYDRYVELIESAFRRSHRPRRRPLRRRRSSARDV